ncbi:MAG: hypothetical protein ACM34K_05760 [Bacillota bacterium]
MEKPQIAIDFDGVIHKYSEGYKDGSLYDDPMPGVKEALEKLSKDYDLVIHTTRTNFDDIRKYLEKYGLSEYISDISNEKPKMAKVFIDDRALNFQSWDKALKDIEKNKVILFGKSLYINPLIELKYKTQSPIFGNWINYFNSILRKPKSGE